MHARKHRRKIPGEGQKSLDNAVAVSRQVYSTRLTDGLKGFVGSNTFLGTSLPLYVGDNEKNVAAARTNARTY